MNTVPNANDDSPLAQARAVSVQTYARIAGVLLLLSIASCLRGVWLEIGVICPKKRRLLDQLAWAPTRQVRCDTGFSAVARLAGSTGETQLPPGSASLRRGLHAGRPLRGLRPNILDRVSKLQRPPTAGLVRSKPHHRRCRDAALPLSTQQFIYSFG